MKSNPDAKVLFAEIDKLSTEQRNPRSMDIDKKPIIEILKIINEEDKLVPLAVEKELPFIEKAVEIIVNALKNGGRFNLLRCRNQRKTRRY